MPSHIKTALITGGANGIGRAIAIAFSKKGYNVIIADICEETGRQLEISYSGIQFIATDFSQPDEIEKLFELCLLSKKSIDILINNVGISVFKLMTELSVDEWDRIINTNLRAAFLCSKQFALQRNKGDFGRIINISSTRSLMSEPHSEAYAASKGGLVSLTHAMALSLQDSNLTVNCISPGWIHTSGPSNLKEADHQQHPSQRVGIPDDVANMCLFLCAPDNNFINGQNIYIDGGMTKKMIYVE